MQHIEMSEGNDTLEEETTKRLLAEVRTAGGWRLANGGWRTVRRTNNRRVPLYLALCSLCLIGASSAFAHVAQLPDVLDA